MPAATPASDALPLFEERYQAHSPEAGRNESSEVLVKAATPHSMPNAIHGVTPVRSSISSVRQKISASRNAARLVSHTAAGAPEHDRRQERPHPRRPNRNFFAETFARAIEKLECKSVQKRRC